MEKQTIVIRANSKEMAEKLYRGVWAVCPDADIQLHWPGMNVAYGRQASSFKGSATMMGSACPVN
ncbi:hypothetical protein KXR87_13155 [Yokenella regensburgei]|uniref:hypothetical protein n=1 Tax=Yokenella regensburgei TaxID=158877 RepID=UPI003F14D8B3